MTLLSFVIAAILSSATTALVFYLLGRLIQQRKQVLELRQTNVTVFQDNQRLQQAYAYLQEQVKKIQSGPVAAALSFEQVNQIAEVVSAKIDLHSGKKSVN